MVGTRRATIYGRQVTEEIVADLARNKITIVSGLARGIDSVAHRTALESGGRTIAVSACGLDTVYPAENAELARRIVHQGALISEYPLGTKPKADYFPRRNRIMSGMSLGVFIVEADENSGAMITAKCALEQNRDVFALPGSIFAKTSEGANELIKKGAKLVACADDILEEYGLESKKVKKIIRAESPEEEKILTMLTDEPATADDIIRKTGLTASQANATLMIMELGKKIKNLGGGKFVLYE